jgi:hypothetical protein
MKMAKAMFVETKENPRDSTRLIPESRSYTEEKCFYEGKCELLAFIA